MFSNLIRSCGLKRSRDHDLVEPPVKRSWFSGGRDYSQDYFQSRIVANSTSYNQRQGCYGYSRFQGYQMQSASDQSHYNYYQHRNNYVQPMTQGVPSSSCRPQHTTMRGQAHSAPSYSAPNASRRIVQVTSQPAQAKSMLTSWVKAISSVKGKVTGTNADVKTSNPSSQAIQKADQKKVATAASTVAPVVSTAKTTEAAGVKAPIVSTAKTMEAAGVKTTKSNQSEASVQLTNSVQSSTTTQATTGIQSNASVQSSTKVLSSTSSQSKELLTNVSSSTNIQASFSTPSSTSSQSSEFLTNVSSSNVSNVQASASSHSSTSVQSSSNVKSTACNGDLKKPMTTSSASTATTVSSKPSRIVKLHTATSASETPRTAVVAKCLAPSAATSLSSLRRTKPLAHVGLTPMLQGTRKKVLSVMTPCANLFSSPAYTITPESLVSQPHSQHCASTPTSYSLFSEVQNRESRHLEFKEAGGRYFEDMWPLHVEKYACAFLNSGGGKLMAGVRDNGVVVGIWADYARQCKIREVAHRIIGQFQPKVPLRLYELSFVPVYKSGRYCQDEYVVELLVHPAEPLDIYGTARNECYMRFEGSVRPVHAQKIKAVVRERYLEVIRKRMK